MEQGGIKGGEGGRERKERGYVAKVVVIRGMAPLLYYCFICTTSLRVHIIYTG